MLTSNRFANFSVDTMKPLPIELASKQPALLAVTESVRKSFFRFVQGRRTLEELPEKTMRGTGMSKADREKLTMLQLVLPEPANVAGLQLLRKERVCDKFLQAPVAEDIKGGNGIMRETRMTLVETRPLHHRIW